MISQCLSAVISDKHTGVIRPCEVDKKEIQIT